MSFEDNGDSLASEGLFTPFFVSLHIFPLPLPRLLLPHDFPGIFYADFDVAVVATPLCPLIYGGLWGVLS